jgi:biopolymer transport protein ExbB
MGTSSFSILEIFQLGGPIMWPLLLFSIAAVAIAIERGVYLFYHKLNMDEMTVKVSEYVSEKDFSGASEYLSGLTERHMGSRILLKLIGEKKQGQAFLAYRAERAAELEAVNCIGSLENGFNFLVALGSLSPLTGFLGTVTGMISAFRSIAEATEVNAQIVANGIYEALITTVFGLVIAIIAMVSHSIFSHIVDRFASGVENACSTLIAQIDEMSSDEVKTAVTQENTNKVKVISEPKENVQNAKINSEPKENINIVKPEPKVNTEPVNAAKEPVKKEPESPRKDVRHNTIAADSEIFWETISHNNIKPNSNDTQKNTGDA